MSSTSSNRDSPELRERAVRLVLDQRSEFASDHHAIRAIAPKIGCHTDTLHLWLRHHENEQDPVAVDDVLSFSERSPLEKLNGEHGVGPVCPGLDIAPSTCGKQEQRV